MLPWIYLRLKDVPGRHLFRLRLHPNLEDILRSLKPFRQPLPRGKEVVLLQWFLRRLLRTQQDEELDLAVPTSSSYLGLQLPPRTIEDTFTPSSTTSSKERYAEFLRFRSESPRLDYNYDFTSSLELTVIPYS